MAADYKIYEPRLCTAKCNCKEGSWVVRWKEAGKGKALHFATESEAKVKWADLQYEFKHHIAGGTTEITFAELLKQVVLTGKALTSGAYKRRLQSDVDKNLLPFFGKMIVSDIKAADVQQYVNDKFSNGYAANTVNKHLVLLRRLLDQAVELGYARYNYAKKVHVGQQRKELNIITVDQVMKLVEVCDNCCLGRGHYASLGEDGKLQPAGGTCLTPYGSFVLAMAYLGLRISEATALMWKHIDFENNIVHIEQAHGYSETAVPFLKEPKSKNGKRQIPLPDILKERLFVESVGKGPDEYVFTTVEGNHIRPDFTQKRFRLMKKKAGFTGKALDMVAHDLRHTYAAILRKSNVSIQELSKRMGHSSVKITDEWYGGFYDDGGASILDSINKVIEEGMN